MGCLGVRGTDVATKVSVTVKGLMGLDDPERMVAELTKATGLPWQAQAAAEDKVLTGGIVEIVLVAVVGKVAEMSVEAALDAVKRVVKHWRAERLDPLEAAIAKEPAPDTDAPACTASHTEAPADPALDGPAPAGSALDGPAPHTEAPTGPAPTGPAPAGPALDGSDG